MKRIFRGEIWNGCGGLSQWFKQTRLRKYSESEEGVRREKLR
jgi:hypothetical protein